MNRNFKMFFFVLIACWMAVFLDIFIRSLLLPRDGEQYDLADHITLALFYSIPFVLLVFGLVFSFNHIMKNRAAKNGGKKWNKDYYLIGLLFVAAIPSVLIIFEYTQRGRYLRDSDFYEKIYSSLFLMGFGLVLLIVNKKLFWKSFNGRV